jgi:hypothetical protein
MKFSRIKSAYCFASIVAVALLLFVGCTFYDNYDITLMLSTHSPYIVNYLNVLLHRPQTEVHLDREQLGVYRVYNGTIQDLMLHGDNPDDIAVDTRDLSETMQTIYNEYVELASAKG